MNKLQTRRHASYDPAARNAAKLARTLDAIHRCETLSDDFDYTNRDADGLRWLKRLDRECERHMREYERLTGREYAERGPA